MPDTNYVVLAAEVTTVTTRIVNFRPSSGQRAGETISAPRALFEDPGLVDVGDDEISIAAWFVARENLTGD